MVEAIPGGIAVKDGFEGGQFTLHGRISNALHRAFEQIGRRSISAVVENGDGIFDDLKTQSIPGIGRMNHTFGARLDDPDSFLRPTRASYVREPALPAARVKREGGRHALGTGGEIGDHLVIAAALQPILYIIVQRPDDLKAAVEIFGILHDADAIATRAQRLTGVFGICTQDGIHMRAGLLRGNEDRPRGLPMKQRFHQRLGSAADGADQKSVFMAVHQSSPSVVTPISGAAFRFVL